MYMVWGQPQETGKATHCIATSRDSITDEVNSSCRLRKGWALGSGRVSCPDDATSFSNGWKAWHSKKAGFCVSLFRSQSTSSWKLKFWQKLHLLWMNGLDDLAHSRHFTGKWFRDDVSSNSISPCMIILGIWNVQGWLPVKTERQDQVQPKAIHQELHKN